MKAFVSAAAIGAGLSVAYGMGYWQGAGSSQERAMLMGARYAATMCVAQNLVELREVTRAVEARSRKPLIVECAR